MIRLNITSKILDKLGFLEYFDAHGTWGERTLAFLNGTNFRIIQQEEMDDDCEGELSNGRYIAEHYYFAGWYAIPPIDDVSFDLFFLHEMYECIEKCYPGCLDEFVAKCRKLKMGEYIDDYLKNRLLSK